MADDALRCELCSGTAFDDVYLPDSWGINAVRTQLKACKECRILFLPPLDRPPDMKPTLPAMFNGRTYGQVPLSTADLKRALDELRIAVSRFPTDERWVRNGDTIVTATRGEPSVCVVRGGDADRLDLIARCDPYRLTMIFDLLRQQRNAT